MCSMIILSKKDIYIFSYICKCVYVQKKFGRIYIEVLDFWQLDYDDFIFVCFYVYFFRCKYIILVV